MECQGEFVFKTFMFRPAGKLIDENGNEVTYSGAYKLKVDQLGEDGSINERTFNIKEDSAVLINTLKQFKAYDKIILLFNVVLYNTRVSLILKDATLIENYDD